MSKDPTSLPRRHLLSGSAALAAAGLAGWSRGAVAADPPVPAAAAPKPLPPYASWKDPASLIVHSSTTIETRRSVFGTSIVTPAEQLYIRNNLPPPDASIDQRQRQAQQQRLMVSPGAQPTGGLVIGPARATAGRCAA